MEAKGVYWKISRIHPVVLAADLLVVAGVLGVGLLAFLGLIPSGLGFGLSFIFGILLFPLDILQRRWLVREFDQLIRRPTWGAATGEALASPHVGNLSVFRAEGRLADEFTWRPATVVIGFDDVAFVALARGPMLSRLQRRVITKGEPARRGASK